MTSRRRHADAASPAARVDRLFFNPENLKKNGNWPSLQRFVKAQQG